MLGQRGQVGDWAVGYPVPVVGGRRRRTTADRKIYKVYRPATGMKEQRYREQADGTAQDKSRAEVQIAGLLDREGIAYRYEHPLAVIDRGKVRIWYPDFYLPDYGTIIEYFGVQGDAEYDRRTEHKMQVYRNTGIEGVFLNEEMLTRQWPTGIIRQIEDVLQQRLRRFHDRPGQPYEPQSVVRLMR